MYMDSQHLITTMFQRPGHESRKAVEAGSSCVENLSCIRICSLKVKGRPLREPHQGLEMSAQKKTVQYGKTNSSIDVQLCLCILDRNESMQQLAEYQRLFYRDCRSDQNFSLALDNPTPSAFINHQIPQPKEPHRAHLAERHLIPSLFLVLHNCSVERKQSFGVDNRRAQYYRWAWTSRGVPIREGRDRSDWKGQKNMKRLRAKIEQLQLMATKEQSLRALTSGK